MESDSEELNVLSYNEIINKIIYQLINLKIVYLN